MKTSERNNRLVKRMCAAYNIPSEDIVSVYYINDHMVHVTCTADDIINDLYYYCTLPYEILSTYDMFTRINLAEMPAEYEFVNERAANHIFNLFSRVLREKLNYKLIEKVESPAVDRYGWLYQMETRSGLHRCYSTILDNTNWAIERFATSEGKHINDYREKALDEFYRYDHYYYLPMGLV